MNPDVTLDTPLAEVLDTDFCTRVGDAFGYSTVGDLLHHLPGRYRGQGQRVDRRTLNAGDRVTIIGPIISATSREYQPRGKNRRSETMVKLVVDDGGTHFGVTFFRAWGIRRQLTTGVVAMFDGTVDFFRGQIGLTHPEYLVLEDTTPGGDNTLKGSGDLKALAQLTVELRAEGGPDLFARPLLPIYPATRTVTSWEILGAIVSVLRVLRPVEDPLDAELRRRARIVDLDTALRTAHLPQSRAEHEAALTRLCFDEAIAMQLYLGARRRMAERDSAAACTPREDGVRSAMLARLPFELTDGQRQVIEEIDADLAREIPMNRLLQGEVGSGKTVVALLAMLGVVDAGRQCVLMAPTEVLAAQHHRSITAMLGDLARAGQLGAAERSTRVVLLTGSMSTAARRRVLLDIVTGEAGIVIGTHAVIQDSVEFFDLGLVVVDEQHRFGVRQRDRLRGKGREGSVPHVLVMTATPIPRTVAMTVFGDLAVSELSQLPGGRLPISTTVVPVRDKPHWVQRAWQRVREEVEAGHRVYVVCSRIGDTDGEDEGEDTGAGPGVATPEPEDGDDGPPPTVAAVELVTELAEGPLAGLRLGLMHGRLPAEDKDAVMADFASGEIDVLVSTTVIEVGVGVPEATVMVVMDSERFGVSQLHQLRGRVGRGGLPGLCLLVTTSRPGGKAYQRLSGVAATTDGFALARLDLELRREGDVLGDAQSGVLGRLRHLSVVDHEDLIVLARTHAEEILTADPMLHSRPALAERVERLAGSEAAAYLFRS